MSEMIWNAGNDPSAMLQSLGAVGSRKQCMVSAALIRRCIRLCKSSTISTLLDQYDSDEADSSLPALRQLLDQELVDLAARQRHRHADSAQVRQSNAAASEGQSVTYPAEVPHAAATLLDEDANDALASAEQATLNAIRIALDSGVIDVIAMHIRDALVDEGRATVLTTIAESWRQYADQIAEQTANQPRKRKLLVSNAVEYIERGRQYLDGKFSTKHREVDRITTSAFVDILRDIFGNPFKPIIVDPRWQSSTVFDLARTIYDQRTFQNMPILGDALMDAGCDSDEIIQHCQGPGSHVRGCWVVDLLLAKE